MLIRFTEPLQLYTDVISNNLGREITTKKKDIEFRGDLQQTNSTLQVELYGDRVKNILTVYSNHNIVNEDSYLLINGGYYKLISKRTYSHFQPTHYIYEFELI
jgi:hypothetical protein